MGTHLEIQECHPGPVVQVNPEVLGDQGALDSLGFLGHLEDQEHRSLEDLDLLSHLERLATLDNIVKTQSFSKN